MATVDGSFLGPGHNSLLLAIVFVLIRMNLPVSGVRSRGFTEHVDKDLEKYVWISLAHDKDALSVLNY